MLERRIPEWLRHAPAPSVRGFAILAGIEAVARGILVSVFPLAMYRALQDASVVSEVYFLVGIASLITGLMVPWLTRFIPRRWVYSIGVAMYFCGSCLAILNEPVAMVAALMLNTISIVIVFVCFNAYVLDYISKIELGKAETQRMFFSALGWTLGPVCGVMLMRWWDPLPFLIAAGASLALLIVFLVMRLGNGKLITRAHKPAPNPLAFVRRFFAQPRLIAGWMFAVVRSCGWWVYVVYLPIYAVENGLGEQTGGIMLSITNGALFLTPFMLRWIQRYSVRYAVRAGFMTAGALFFFAGVLPLPALVVVGLLMLGSFFLILLDVCGGLPFLMAVKPSERTEMSAIYSSFRDVSGILTPGAVWLVLLIAPLSGSFVAAGAGLFGAWMIAGKLHPRLGQAKTMKVQEPYEADQLAAE
ncbi:MFS transporter [Pseudohalocynthiibacter sp. F2068]|jgi:MFS transporter, ACDE family, multidrug resistance protein|uniref:MFS transporter n=1 Tax=Pseudohalocynthiibacter sp. F2068 TaxID=2926418 RepID=UPI001FF60AF1|nr:MFS transporter [Pseudohalocynthiibacter sp. F2068]MCK0104534.1 MFS transporter [Pseudohalocynthiibacter sp. F2068]